MDGSGRKLLNEQRPYAALFFYPIFRVYRAFSPEAAWVLKVY
ncbi:hypothetical protein B4096_0638 [Heyndrickxia coagulans]|uniref:Uncharacterized protein n=1 Tax=Heyndrickxia coagulans TaxID=1398 RepID=A0AAN0WDH2_HEYCO|nr:hypothetical protein SB48_HM08orf05397 [Heyndrickxia coagulans]KYC60321.1 hypothetical protein B4100_0669 [Heyndrickxia coagulans]KYC77676.1 hypothetical protein B4096_0638 [Heyndrickxia coagulans]